MAISLSTLLHKGEFGQFMTNRHTVLTVCRFNGYRTETSGVSLIWRESGTIDHTENGNNHVFDVTALRLVRRVPNLRRAAIGSVFWTIGGYRARIESRKRPNSADEEWEASIHREDGSWKCNIEYNMYGVPRTMPDGSDFDLVWDVNDIDRDRKATQEIDKHPDPAHKDNHSVGDVFPYVPFYKGASCEQWVRCPDGVEEGPFSSIAAMHKFVETRELMREHDALPEFPDSLQVSPEESNYVITTITAEEVQAVLDLARYLEVPLCVDDVEGNPHTLDEYLEITEKSNKLLSED